MKVVLDTHVWFWAVTRPDQIPARSLSVLRNPRNVPFGLSAISLWEIAKLVERGRIRLTMPLQEWMEAAANPDFIEIIPITPRIAIDSTNLPGGFHADPADQLIVASARISDAALITADRKIRSYESVKTMWD